MEDGDVTDLPRVLSYPPRHDYVDRLHGRAAQLVHRDQPWPRLPDLYDPAWVAAHTGEWDVAHLHFTWEQHPVEQVAAVLDAHRTAGVPVVWTAHDLRNPHTAGADVDDPYLRLLADRADHVVTLTRGAAAEVARRFGRRPQVIEHGSLVGARPTRPDRAWPSRVRVLLHAKSLRANLDVAAAIRAAERAVAAGANLELEVAAHDEPAVREQLEQLEPGEGVSVRFHVRWSAGELIAAVAAADALLLPYRWGTHSGMVELAADVGTPVIASDVGYLAEQVRLVSVPVVADAVDVAALTQALRGVAVGAGLPTAPSWGERQRSFARFVAAHRSLYAGLTT